MISSYRDVMGMLFKILGTMMTISSKWDEQSAHSIVVIFMFTPVFSRGSIVTAKRLKML